MNYCLSKLKCACLTMMLPVCAINLLLLVSIFSASTANADSAIKNGYALTTSEIAASLSDHARSNRFPNALEFGTSTSKETVKGRIHYTFDQSVHDEMAKVYLRYQPDYACFVAMDVETGAILNLTSFVKGDEQLDNLVMRSSYPAASVFKMITAAASLDMGKLLPSTVIPYNGKSTTLYKSQVLRHKKTKWTRTPTLAESFAKSVNPVFGQIGVFHVGADKLKEYAGRFGFDRTLKSDFYLPESHLGLALDTQWELAEAGSGYTKDITMSPIHAAQMAAIIANQGKMVTPYMVDSITDSRGELLYSAQLDSSDAQVISSRTASQMKGLLRGTAKIGSARKSFSGLNRYKVYKGMEIGGKTGSLTGFSPKGKHDWFVGYAEKDGRRIAYASLIINKEKWVVRSAYVARQFIYHYFSTPKREALAYQP